MTGLVLADNFILLYAFWEGVGLCSYLLIGFWFARPAAAAAARKAFLVTRLGDIGMFLGILMLWHHCGHDVNYSNVFARSRHARGIRRRPDHGVSAALRRGGGQVGPVSAARLAAGCDGRAVAGQRPDPRRDDGDGRRIPGGPLHAAVHVRSRAQLVVACKGPSPLCSPPSSP